MKKNWIAALVILIAIGSTVTLYKFGVKRAIEASRDQSHSSNSVDGKPGEQKFDENGNPVADSTGASGEVGANGSATGVNAGANGTNGTAGTQPGSSSGQAGSVAEVKKPDNNCFSYEYRHTKEAQNKDIEDFLDYSNAFALLHNNVNEKSMCVKVNNKPVAFKMSKYKSQAEVMIGSVVGPESVIKVSYCIGKVTCKESCTVKSNRFMDDMMSDAGDEDEFKDSWGDSNSAAHTAQKKELQGKVKELRSVASENKDLAQRSVIRTWDTVQKQEWVCKK